MSRPDLLHPGLNGAFVADGFDALPAAAQAATTLQDVSPLAGKRLAVKDVYDVAGLRAGSGNPAWLDEQTPATTSALAVQRLLDGGAQWVGKTVTDELTYSLAGINAHYGTPVNPADPERIPGGSSSGSAVAVAAHHADVGLGTDCGGSVRLPASYCGIWGIRPTHGRIAANGCLTLAHSFDTVGWFARDPQTLIDVFQVLAHSDVPGAAEAPERLSLIAPAEVLAVLNPEVRERFATTMQQLGIAHGALSTTPQPVDLSRWAGAFRVLQAAEIAQQHGRWASAHLDSFGADVRARFETSLTISPAQVREAQAIRVEVNRLTGGATFAAKGRYWCFPTLPWIAPRTDASREEVDDVRTRSQQMLCIGGLAGLPQVNLPWETFAGAPLGLSIVGARGDDEGVLMVARAVHGMLAAS